MLQVIQDQVRPLEQNPWVCWNEQLCPLLFMNKHIHAPMGINYFDFNDLLSFF